MATITVTIKEEVTLNGKDRGSENVMSVSGINQTDNRIVTVPTASEVSIVKFGTAVDAGQFEDATTEYLRITNLDDTNYVTLRISGSSEEYMLKLEPEGTFMMNNSLMDAYASNSNTATLAAIDEIKAKANSADVDVEIFVATT